MCGIQVGLIVDLLNLGSESAKRAVMPVQVKKYLGRHSLFLFLFVHANVLGINPLSV